MKHSTPTNNQKSKTIFGSIIGVVNDFVDLLVPSKCVSCGINLLKVEKDVCNNCIYQLAKTHFLNIKDNPVSQAFWGRIDVEQAYAQYYFSKDGILQRLIHNIKYHGGKEMAFELGKQTGHDLKSAGHFSTVDLIIPVPLHPLKEKKRGYNQSDWIARGIAEILEIHYQKDVLKRTIYTPTQTKKSREQRWENVKDAFEVALPAIASNKHILVVDDVLTTGATLEACATKLMDVSGTRVSVVCLAVAAD